mmetsp:Transcript_88660/g.264485  ORF Transcript_88660/g.264485 Transcript_88660/m.264485 type:complete len:246 (+) Transcript_88660:420-1157(+)
MATRRGNGRCFRRRRRGGADGDSRRGCDLARKQVEDLRPPPRIEDGDARGGVTPQKPRCIAGHPGRARRHVQRPRSDRGCRGARWAQSEGGLHCGGPRPKALRLRGPEADGAVRAGAGQAREVRVLLEAPNAVSVAHQQPGTQAALYRWEVSAVGVVRLHLRHVPSPDDVVHASAVQCPILRAIRQRQDGRGVAAERGIWLKLVSMRRPPPEGRELPGLDQPVLTARDQNSALLVAQDAPRSVEV